MVRAFDMPTEKENFTHVFVVDKDGVTTEV
jgi:hypothetical protein